ncbi:MAG: septation protein IspZ [Pseudomonadota bacterium]
MSSQPTPATQRPLRPGLKLAVEYGPLLAFLGVYLVYRNATFQIAGTDYSGFIVVTAGFIPVFLAATGALWYLTGHVARIQLFVSAMLVLFGLLGVWFNDPRLFKMKPPVIYGALALILAIGLMRQQSWLKFIMENMIPLKEQGWMALTKRVTALCAAAAIANEIVWRTQSETVWVFFETLAMPIIVVAFFVGQFGLFVEYASFKREKKKKKAPKPVPSRSS